jgi:hypothetical protein
MRERGRPKVGNKGEHLSYLEKPGGMRQITRGLGERLDLGRKIREEVKRPRNSLRYSFSSTFQLKFPTEQRWKAQSDSDEIWQKFQTHERNFVRFLEALLRSKIK